ncbi:MAG TPA: ATP-binding protein [Vicinamibacterales bacterium]|nr:ATP-binding protein [Vicinamibacterales bacterium]
MNCPAYFDEIRRRSRSRWDQLESDPELAAPWHQLFKQVQSPRHVLSELLQNADDAGATETGVRIDGGYFVFTHNGEDFTEEHFASLCRFGYSNKRALHTIGFRGIGFKSTFSLGDVVELHTPTLSVAFDRTRFTEPRWLAVELAAGQQTTIRVALTSDHVRREVEKNLHDWLKSPLSLLFFKHIRRMRIGEDEVHWGSLGPGPVRDSEWMALHDDPDESYLVATSEAEAFPAEALNEIRQERLLSVDHETEFPPCKVEIVVGVKGQLYVVLPTGVETPLPFACNAPFIQDPARLKIKDPETSPTNQWLLERVGRLAAAVMLEWLKPSTGSVAARAEAYSVFPDVDREDTSLEGSCGATVEEAFDAAITGTAFLLTESGDLQPAGGAVLIPAAVLDVWPEAQAAAILDAAARPALSRQIAAADQQKLSRWNVIEAISKAKLLEVLRTTHVPKPESWRHLLNLWAYLAPELTHYQYYATKQHIRIAPVQGQDVLYSATEVVRLGEKRLLQSEADWEFLAAHLLVLNQNWTRFLAEQRRLAEDQGSNRTDVEAAYAVLSSLGLVDSSDASYVLDRVAADFFASESIPLAGCVQFAQIAAKLGAAANKSFRFATRDLKLRGIDQDVLFDVDGTLEAILPEAWCASHCLHQDYAKFASCTSDEWTKWITSGRAALSTLPPLRPKSQNFWSRRQLDDELLRRAFAGTVSPPYVTSSFSLDDWDFDELLWKHWATLAHQDSALWGHLVERILSQPDTYTTKARTARALQTATTGNTKPATYDPIIPSWILRFRELPCLRDTRGTPRKPGDLLRRTPQTEPFLDVEFFVHAVLDVEAARPLLTLLGVRDTPTTPDRLINCLRALAAVDKPPVAEVEKWYRRLDQMLDTASTTEAAKIRNVFGTEKLIFTDGGAWATAGGVFLNADEEDVPGAAIVRASVQDLALWHKVGVADRPSADLALRWLSELTSEQSLSQDDLRRVRALLARHPGRVWSETGHWLNLAAQWAPVADLSYALTMQSLVPWSHLHEWVKQATADLQRVSTEIADGPPFAAIPRLAESIEERLNMALLVVGTPERKTWLTQLGVELRRVQLDDGAEVAWIATLAERLEQTVWVEGPELELVPYIGGTPAGTPRRADAVWADRTLHVVRRPAARLARVVSQELGRTFRRQDIADAIKLCFDRPPDFVTDYMEENFNLVPRTVVTSDGSQAAATEPAANISPRVTDSTETEPSTLEVAAEESAASGSVDAEADSVATSQEAPARHRHHPAQKPSIIDRFARSLGFLKDGDDRFYHPDGAWIARISGAPFPWERRTAGGELVRAYWGKEHCLDQEPLQLGADLWGLIDKFPDRYSLVLASPFGDPIEVPGASLRAMVAQGQLKIYPAAYRLVVGVQA